VRPQFQNLKLVGRTIPHSGVLKATWYNQAMSSAVRLGLRMTIREIINRKLKTTGIIIFSGIGVFVLGALYSMWRGDGPPPIISFIGFFVAIIAIIFLHFGIRCPYCKNLLGFIAMYRGFEFSNPFLASRKFKYCPYCRKDIDLEVEIDKKV
jgi:hypothetical protein